MSEPRPVPPVDTTLRRIVIAYRVLTFAWMSAAAGSTVVTDEGADDLWVVLAWLAAAAGTSLVVASSGNRRLLTSWPLLIGDLALSTFIGLAPGPAGSVDLFFGGYLISTLILLVYARPAIALGLAAVGILSATQILVPMISDARSLRPTDAAGDIAALAVTTAVFGWGIETIRRSETRRMEAEEALSREQMLRARSDERAEIGRHLHDSVLQTLALIEQRTDDPGEVAHLARRQERELRRWIDQMSSPHVRSFRAALRDAAADVEDRYRVRVDLVVVGDREMDEPSEAAVRAAGEALVNAAKHSGCERIDLYAETGPEETRIFVRDRGSGFDPPASGEDHRGLRDSIVGRMARHGGEAKIHSEPGRGTEIEIILGRSRP